MLVFCGAPALIRWLPIGMLVLDGLPPGIECLLANLIQFVCAIDRSSERVSVVNVA